jgi:O-antigen/teichoic acid export membrane protein
MTPRIQHNIVANFATRAWGFVSAYLFVPVYLKYLGIEAYGLVGFYSTLLAVLAFADMGFTATLNRELARLSVRDDSAAEMRDLLRTYESVYVVISLAVAATLWMSAPWFSGHWLRTNVLQPAEATAAIRFLGFSIALQLPSALYLGGLMGLQQQVRAAHLQIAAGALRGIGGVLVLWLVSPTILAFALWQLAANAINCVAVRLSLWRTLTPMPAQVPPRFRRQVLQSTWRYAAGMAGMAVLSTLQTQTDKLVVSKMLPLETFGYYTLAGTLASLPLLLGSAISSAVFPRLTGFVEVKRDGGLVDLYHQSCELMAVAIFPAGLTLAAFAGPTLFAWTGSAAAAEQGGLAASLLILGQLAQVMMFVPFALGLAHGNIRLTIQTSAASVLLMVPLTIVLIMRAGVAGAGLAWLATNICILPAFGYTVHRRFLPRELGRWFRGAILVPLLVGSSVVLSGRWLLPYTPSRVWTLCLIGLVWSASTAATALTVPSTRTRFVRETSRILGISAQQN